MNRLRVGMRSASRLAFAGVVAAIGFGVLGASASHEQPSNGAGSAAAVRVEARTSASCVDVSGTWHTFQGNAGAFTFVFHQTGSNVTGTATNGSTLHGTLTGHVTGNHLVVIVTWNFKRSDGSALQGEYEATIGNGTLTGSTHDVANPASHSTWTGTGPTKACVLQPVKINILFFASSALTAPPAGGGVGVPSTLKCAIIPQPANVDGHIEAQITPDGREVGTGYVHDAPHDRRCHDPRIKFAVDGVAIQILKSEHVIRATLRVHIDQEAVHRPGQCRVGLSGVVTALYDDTKGGTNGLSRSDQLEIGPWSAPGCNAHNHLITNNMSTVPADAKGSTWVRAEIFCLGDGMNGESFGYGPRNCRA